MDLTERLAEHFQVTALTHQDASELLTPMLATAIGRMGDALLANGRIFVHGTGHCAMLAEHLVANLVGNFERERPELAAIALPGAVARHSFNAAAQGLHALGQAGDLCILFMAEEGREATSLLAAAHQREVSLIVFSGEQTAHVADQLGEQDLHIMLAASRPARLLELQLTIVHALCDGIDYLLMGDDG